MLPTGDPIGLSVNLGCRIPVPGNGWSWEVGLGDHFNKEVWNNKELPTMEMIEGSNFGQNKKIPMKKKTQR